MYRLTDDLAARRRHYPPPVPGMPHLVLLDLPHRMRGPSLALNRYYVVLPETEEEVAEFVAFLAHERPGPVRPALLDDRPSAIRSSSLLVIRYEPPKRGWPWVTVCRWPGDVTPTVGQHVEMARGCYSFEAFEDRASADESAIALLTVLRRRVDVSVRWLSADHLGQEGRA